MAYSRSQRGQEGVLVDVLEFEEQRARRRWRRAGWRFIIACGAVPTVAWLNGLSGGESDSGALLDLHISKGAAILNIIPDRNWNYSDEAKRKKWFMSLTA